MLQLLATVVKRGGWGRDPPCHEDLAQPPHNLTQQFGGEEGAIWHRGSPHQVLESCIQELQLRAMHSFSPWQELGVEE